MSAALEGGEVGSRIATLPDARRWPSRVRARQLLVRYTRRLGVALLLALGVALLLRSEWTQGFGSVLGRTATLALAGVLAFSISEQWPRRLPRWLPRWVLQVVATGAAMPSTTLVVYILSTEAGAPPFWQDRDRMEGFMTLTFLGILLAPWMALGALVRARESFARDQALAFELERSHLEREAVEARLRLLEAQVAPHFLFNTLANIQALVDAGSPRASAVLRSLVVYLRAAVPELGAPARTVARELDLVRAYLELMQMRMPDRLRFELVATSEFQVQPPRQQSIRETAGAGRLSTARIYILRATYLLIVAGLGVDIWPRLLLSPVSPGLAQGVVRSLLAAVALMAAIGIWHPVKMLPLLLFELSWKSIWLAAVGMPVWFTGSMDPSTWETFKACLMGLIIFPPVIPWRFVMAELAGAPAVPWRHGKITPRAHAAQRPSLAGENR